MEVFFELGHTREVSSFAGIHELGEAVPRGVSVDVARRRRRNGCIGGRNTSKKNDKEK